MDRSQWAHVDTRKVHKDMIYDNEIKPTQVGKGGKCKKGSITAQHEKLKSPVQLEVDLFASIPSRVANIVATPIQIPHTVATFPPNTMSIRNKLHKVA